MAKGKGKKKGRLAKAEVGTVVRLTAEDLVEVGHGLRALDGALKRAAQLGAALELDADGREDLADRAKQLRAGLDGKADYELAGSGVYPVRVAIRLRHGQLKRLVASEKDRGGEPSEDAEGRIGRLETLGRKLGIQLDLIDHPEDAKAED
mgnify:FL=1